MTMLCQVSVDTLLRSFTCSKGLVHIIDVREQGSRGSICGYDGMRGYKALSGDAPTCLRCVVKWARWDFACRYTQVAPWALMNNGTAPPMTESPLSWLP